MVDAGGGNGILKILDNMQVPLERIHHIFVTHAHTDHVLGIVWMIRMIATKMKKDQYIGDAHIYCHAELIETIKTLCRLTIQDKFYNMIGDRIHLEEVKDGETRHILSYDVTFFDIRTVNSMCAAVTGYSTRRSASMRSAISGSRMKSITAP